MHVRDGVLRFADGSEVNLWGVNFQPALSWEHAARMEPHGLFVPLQVADLKRMTDESFDQIQRLGSTVIRIHLCPADFFNGKGQLVERIWLDLLDYTLAEARKRGIYVYLTLDQRDEQRRNASCPRSAIPFRTPTNARNGW